MKKLILAFMCAFLLAGCTKGKDDDTNVVNSESLRIKDIFPFSENTLYDYEGVGSAYAGWDIYIDYVNDNKIQRRIAVDESGSSFVEVLEIVDGELRIVYSENKFFRHENLMDKQSNAYGIILKEPIELGATWNVGEGEVSAVTNVNADVETPYGSFKAAIEITTTNGDGRVYKNYYVKGLGLVKYTTYYEEVGEVVTQLSKIEEGRLTSEITVFAYESETDSLVGEQREITIGTNEDILLLLENHLKQPNSNKTEALFGEGVKINSVDIVADEVSMTIDLSKEFINGVSGDDAKASNDLQCLVNTLGDFYSMQWVKVTVNGEIYSPYGSTVDEDGYSGVLK